MRLPDSKPVDDPAGLWAMQGELLTLAESLLGTRDVSKKIYQPRFSRGGIPQIRNTPRLDGAFVELSRYGESYWPTVIFEMAHETVHLLNPTVGNTNNLEEGVATAFSIEIQPSYGINIRPTIPSYIRALQLCRRLSAGPLVAGETCPREIQCPRYCYV